MLRVPKPMQMKIFLMENTLVAKRNCWKGKGPYLIDTQLEKFSECCNHSSMSVIQLYSIKLHTVLSLFNALGTVKIAQLLH